MKAVSACLAGINCRYDGKSKSNERVIKLIKEGKAILICPEQLGGLPTPREPCEIVDGIFLTKKGADLSDNFIRGAKEALKIVQMYGCDEIILKSNSPSCGCGKIYDGTFSGKLISGDGVFTKLLKENGIKVISEDNL